MKIKIYNMSDDNKYLDTITVGENKPSKIAEEVIKYLEQNYNYKIKSRIINICFENQIENFIINCIAENTKNTENDLLIKIKIIKEEN